MKRMSLFLSDIRSNSLHAKLVKEESIIEICMCVNEYGL